MAPLAHLKTLLTYNYLDFINTVGHTDLVLEICCSYRFKKGYQELFRARLQATPMSAWVSSPAPSEPVEVQAEVRELCHQHAGRQ